MGLMGNCGGRGDGGLRGDGATVDSRAAVAKNVRRGRHPQRSVTTSSAAVG